MKKFFIFVFIFLIPVNVSSFQEKALSQGETVYVSVYSHVYGGPKQSKVKLSSILSIRNTDTSNRITISKVDYYDTKGKYIESYIKSNQTLGPLETTNFYIREYDMRGGSGAKFIVKWHSAKKVNQPAIESLMLGLMSGQGISFVCRGINLKSN
ncbi:MAG: hypothetical protein CSA18_03140 [Deltaproteobacteria bacterium]|nr:MAG: hypothetical protein CSA18_03140 [Deltaproteobacteria bacterium]